LQLRPKIVEEFIQRVFSECDFLLAPTFNVETPTIEETDVLDHQGFEAVIARVSRCTRPINYLTLPGLALPTPSLVAGMPGSIQLIGPPFSEAGIYRAAAAYEAEAGYTKRRPEL
ncbi:MAG: amidase family protein, partial [Rhodospirillales bacterium]